MSYEQLDSDAPPAYQPQPAVAAYQPQPAAGAITSHSNPGYTAPEAKGGYQQAAPNVPLVHSQGNQNYGSYQQGPPQYGYTQQYPGQPGAPPVMVLPQPVIYVRGRSFDAQIALSCFVFWCCGWMFGLIAFIVALMAKDRDSQGQSEEATKLGKISMWISFVGIVVGIVVIITVIVVSASNN